MNKQEKYLQWVINDIKKNTYLEHFPTQVMFGGIFNAFPAHFQHPPLVSEPDLHTASIFRQLAKTLSLNYGLTEDEMWIIVDEVYPWIVDNLLSDYTFLR